MRKKSRKDYIKNNLEGVKNRFLQKIVINKKTKCWEWTAHKSKLGYGVMRYGPRALGVREAHIIAYEIFTGPVPEGKELDHLCRNRGCVNPSHLEPVTHHENMRRGHHATKTHCKNGHEFDEKNTLIGKNGRRHCRKCADARRKKHKEKLCRQSSR